MSCESLKSLKLPETTITAAEFITQLPWTSPGGTSLSHCLNPVLRVVGVVTPAINFEVWLPPAKGDESWNGKFNGVGNGGLAVGSITRRC